MYRILLVDDDPNLRQVLGYHLKKEGYEVNEARDGREALELLKEGTYDLLVTDVRMPRMDGLALLEQSKALNPDLPALLLTAYGTIQDAVEAMRTGAADYLTKPVEKDQLLKVVRKTLQVGELQRENRRLRQNLEEKAPLDAILGTSPPIQQVKEMIRRTGPTDATVLVTGESGTGKELAARALHRLSHRALNPFVVINCAAISGELLESELFGHTKGAFTGAVSDHAGKFKQADGGTLFLDEIGDMDLRLQAKILRALQERVIEPVGSATPVPVNVRMIAATNRDLITMVRNGEFREDLFYRLDVISIRMPPLRERGEDVLLLLKTFCRRYSGANLELDQDARRLLSAYSWPGNIRELQNLCQRLGIMFPGERMTSDMLPQEIKGKDVSSFEPHSAVTGSLWDMERAAIIRALREAGGNKSAAARALNIPRHVLLYRLKKFEIQS